MSNETGPIYNVPLIESLPMGDTGMAQAMPSRADLEQTRKFGDRVAAGYEVLLSHYEALRRELAARQKNVNVFKPHWPEGLEQETVHRVTCDDKGRNGGTWLQVFVANDGDVHVAMQDWEDIPEGKPSAFPSVRIRTHAGGGQHARTRQALLWLAEAIRLDNLDYPHATVEACTDRRIAERREGKVAP